MSGSSRTQVAIAGAGPVGCLLALMLARAGVKVSVLEAEPGLVQDLRASTFHPPTLDMLAPAGITRELIARGLITPKFQYRDREAGLVAEFDHAVLAGLTDHPYRLQCEQYKFTAVLVDMLSAYTEVDLRFNARVTALRQDCDGVTVTYGGRFGEGHIECDFLVGCDGSRSTVRKQLGVDFQGFTYPEHFVTASVAEAIDDIVPGMGHVAYIADPNEWCVLIHAPAFWRFLFPVPIEMSQAQALDDDYLQARLQRLAPYPGRFKVGHRTLYTVNQRVAQSYRAGRALLAGDAAHVNNPVGGMGMNGGIHDAINLAEKLVAIIKQGASNDQLDVYDRQRRPIAIEYVQRQSIQNKRLIEESDPQVRRAHQDELREIASSREKTIALLKQTSMLNAVQQSADL